MSGPWQGVGGPQQAPAQAHHDLQVRPDGLVLAREQGGLVLPAPTGHERAVDDVQALARDPLGRGQHRPQSPGDDPGDRPPIARKIVGCETPMISAIAS